MRKIFFSIIMILSIRSFVIAEPAVISAAIASSRSIDTSLVASVDFLREKFMALVVNESEWVNEYDANGIYRCILDNILSNQIQFDISKAKHRTKFVRYMTRVGKRTFDFDSPWLGLTTKAEIEHHIFRQSTGNPRWTRSLKPDCSQPATWEATYPNSQWAGFKKRCAKTAIMTLDVLNNKVPNFCRTLDGKSANPRWWGGHMDLHRVEKNWEEIICDAPGMVCTREDRMSSNTPKGCTKNWYFRVRE